MKVYLYKLSFKGPTHFGETGIDLENVSEWVNSDTFFSALINTFSSIENSGTVTEFINSFQENPPFLITSLFLYFKDKYFLPKPIYDEHIDADLKKQFGKELKKIKWLDVLGFKKWIGKSGLTRDDLDLLEEVNEMYKKAFFIEIRPRVSLDRITQNSTIYHAGYVHFNKEAGLYGFVVFNDTSKISQFKMLLEILGNIGLGGEKTYGCGMFEVIKFQEISGLLKETIEMSEENSIGYTTLSLYHPSEAELAKGAENILAYDVIRKKGWISSGRQALPIKRKSVGFIKEGSVLKKRPLGCIVDVTPDNVPLEVLSHRIFRYGYAFSIPIGRIQ